MIIRIYRGTVFPGKEHAWQNSRTAVNPVAEVTTGSDRIYRGKPMRASGSRTFCMVMVWDSVDSIAAAVGEDWKIPNYLGDEAELIEKSELDHFELYP